MAAADNLKVVAILVVVAIFLVARQTAEAVTVDGTPNVEGISVNFTLCCTKNLLCNNNTQPLKRTLVYITADATTVTGITQQVVLGFEFTNSLGNVNINVFNLNIVGVTAPVALGVVSIQNVTAVISISLFSSSCTDLSIAGTVNVKLVATGPSNNGIITLTAAI